MGRPYKKQHPMMKAWLARLAAEVKRRRGDEKQDAFAARIGVARQTLSKIEGGKQTYGIDPLLKILAGVDSDPVISLLKMSKDWNSIDTDTIDACRLIVEAFSDARKKKLAQHLLETLKLQTGEAPSTPRKET